MKTPWQIYEAYTTGDPLTDEELKVGIEHFQKIADLAFDSGPVFRLMEQEATRVVVALSQFQFARLYQKEVAVHQYSVSSERSC